ncbi:uncharacterized protein LOC109199909 isoform X3 [Oreochromis niloticus]|uniref:uncharacterized protein LOC109199909 isoform X3 n=1 Tax=Oreochromis niloticus TaxID=8128 RepID=UPI000DF348CF|nr:uncharacterized protein LOC109199909 isoform X3 [Oreochromis niloticus]
MSHLGVSFYVISVFILGVSDKALTATIQTQQTVLAAVGEDAEFSCQLLETKDVLQNCSIVIRNVTVQDEGCYHCLFNTYPEGSFTGKPCLQVYELHEPVVDVRESNSTEEWVVSCSATGRPAPTVTLSVSQQDLNFSQYNTVSVSNTNATFTVTTTAVLSGSRKHSTQVGCAARVLSAPHREVMVTIPDDDDDGFNEKSGSNQRNLVLRISVMVVSVLLVACGFLAPLIFLLLRKKTQSSLSHRETVKIPEITIRDNQEHETPSVNQSENRLKKWRPPETN